MSVVKSSEISQRRADGDAVAAKMAEIGGDDDGNEIPISSFLPFAVD